MFCISIYCLSLKLSFTKYTFYEVFHIISICFAECCITLLSISSFPFTRISLSCCFPRTVETKYSHHISYFVITFIVLACKLFYKNVCLLWTIEERKSLCFSFSLCCTSHEVAYAIFLYDIYSMCFRRQYHKFSS